MTTDPEYDITPDPPSKSARKREHHELQQLAATLLALPAAELARIPLGPALAAALEATRSITQHEARRRQLQYLGKLMRNSDHQQIRAALAGLQGRQRQFRQHLERTDRLCADLMAGGDEAIEALIGARDQAAETTAEPALDRQRLRQLVRKARQPNAPENARRKLFDYLRLHAG